MRERPILFSGPMVRAILAGRKTQTRRAFNDKANLHFIEGQGDLSICPYGQPGDRLWVREAWGVVSHAWNADGDMIDWAPDRPATAIHEMPFGNGYYDGHVIYAADGPYEWSGGGEPRTAWKPSIHMPRRASRITLEITGVRVERLLDISEADCIAEGASGGHGSIPSYPYNATPDEHFKWIWESVGGDWAANPWVWAVEFQRMES